MSTFKDQIQTDKQGLIGAILHMSNEDASKIFKSIEDNVNTIAIHYLESMKLLENLAEVKSTEGLGKVPLPAPIDHTVMEAILDEVDEVELTDIQKAFVFITVVKSVVSAAQGWINNQYQAKGNELIRKQVESNQSRIIKPFGF